MERTPKIKERTMTKEEKKFRDSDIYYMRTREKRTLSDLAIIYDLSPASISTICKREKWKNIKKIWLKEK